MTRKRKSNRGKFRDSIITIVIVTAVVAICAFSFGIYRKNTALENLSYTVFPELLPYKDMDYGTYRETTGRELDFEHGGLFAGEVPERDVQLVMSGSYEEELAGYELKEDSRVIRLQGRLADLISMEENEGKGVAEMAVEDFVDKMRKQNGGSLSCEFLEGAGTAYYVDNYYISIRFDSDGDGRNDMLLEISLGSEARSERVGPDSYAWLYLAMPEPE